MDWQSVEVVDEAAAEPVHLYEAKRHLNVDIDEDDAYIEGLIAAGRELVEAGNGRAIVVRTFEAALDCFPDCLELKLPRPPLVSVESITYTLRDGTELELDPETYLVDTRSKPGRVILREGESWPSDALQVGPAVVVRYVAGMITPYEVHAGSNVVTAFGREFEDGESVQLSNSGGEIPGGLAARTQYFVVNSTGSSFNLSDTAGGAPIDIQTTPAGDGSNFIGRPRYLLVRGILLLVGHWYENREAVQEARRSILLELPLGIQTCILTDRLWKF